MSVHNFFALLASREFLVNFFANLGGAMFGVLLAFWVERTRARHDARAFYGRTLRTSRSELAYVKPMCDRSGGELKAGHSGGTGDMLDIPATRALLLNPLIHDHAPYSLIMAITVLCSHVSTTQSAFLEARPLRHQSGRDPAQLGSILGDQLLKLSQLIAIALEHIDAELTQLRLSKAQDPATQEVSRRLLAVLQSGRSLR